MIIGTAGHIDHGKTTLVKALTGVDTDRLPEEKQRGVSIELGYAFLDAPDDTRLGFVDVPGHERLVHTMLSGATGIDHALLLVAADDGPMPQTHEHLAVLSLLGLQHATVVVTKVDRAAPERVADVAAQCAALLAATPLAGAPVLAVSAATGEGLDALRQRLFAVAAVAQRHPRAGDAFRLALDRVFTLAGVGTVATGTVHAGSVALGDEVAIVPGDGRARVRSLHAQNRAVALAEAGQRCAVGLAGVDRDQVRRGQWLVAPGVALATSRFDATLTLWHGEARALRSGTQVHVHLGAAAGMGSVALLDGESLAPGARARAQIVLREPLGAWHGDRVVLRDASASRTLAGGTVLDPLAPARYRRTPQRLAELDAMLPGSATDRLCALLVQAPHGVDLRRFAAAQGVNAAPDPGSDAMRTGGAHGDWALGAAQAAEARGKILADLQAFHARAPDELGPDAARLRRLSLPRLPDPLWQALIAELLATGSVARRGACLHLPDHGVRLSATEERLAQKVAPALAACGYEGAWVRDLARDSGESEALMRVTLARLAQRGELHQIVRDLFLPASTVHRLLGVVRQAAADGELTAAQFRDATGLGRKRAIQVLEYFDRIGVLRRVGDVHRVRGDSDLLVEATA